MLRATWDRWSQLSLLFLMSVGGDLQKVSEEGTIGAGSESSAVEGVF